MPVPYTPFDAEAGHEERDDFEEQPPKGFFRLTPGAEARLRYAFIVRCVGADKDDAGNVVAVHCTYDATTRSGTPGAENFPSPDAVFPDARLISIDAVWKYEASGTDLGTGWRDLVLHAAADPDRRVQKISRGAIIIVGRAQAVRVNSSQKESTDSDLIVLGQHRPKDPASFCAA